MDLPGIENPYRLSQRVYSGGLPSGDASFAALARLGVRTVISVDGLTPDVATARRHGLRYVHVPVGYDGIGPDKAARLAKAVRDLPSPVFVHCHHGKHRGPTAAALALMATEDWTPERALAWLGLAGTSPQYPGLFACVRAFRPPGRAALDALPADWPETAPVPPLVEAMVQVDTRWDTLTAVKASGWATPADHPDVVPRDEATLLAEHFRELARGDDAARLGPEFRRALGDAAASAGSLADRIAALARAPGDSARRDEAAAAFDRVQRSCNACHARFRNPPR